MENLPQISLEHSQHLAGVATALANVQAELRSLKKDTEGYGYRYSSISEIMDYLLPILSKNGLAISQFGGSGRELITMLIHTETGEYLKGRVTLPDPKDMEMKSCNIAQKDGSLRTYFKRYSVCEIVGLTSNEEDNDASPNGFASPKKSYTKSSKKEEKAPPANKKTSFKRTSKVKNDL